MGSNSSSLTNSSASEPHAPFLRDDSCFLSVFPCLLLVAILYSMFGVRRCISGARLLRNGSRPLPPLSSHHVLSGSCVRGFTSDVRTQITDWNISRDARRRRTSAHRFSTAKKLLEEEKQTRSNVSKAGEVLRGIPGGGTGFTVLADENTDMVS